jgi:hypothetical protein
MRWRLDLTIAPSNSLLTRHVRHSIAQAITTFKHPYAVLVDTSGKVEDYATITYRSPCTFAHILRNFRELNLDRSLFKIVLSTTVYIADLKEWYEHGNCRTDPLDMQKHASLLMYRLFDWYQHSEYGGVGEHDPTNYVDRSVCLALMIFMVYATEPNAPSFGPRLHKAVFKLRKSLQQVPVLRWGRAPDLLFWVLTMGALGAKSLPRKHKAQDDEPSVSFFQGHIRLAFANSSPDDTVTADQVLEKMRTCLWIPSVFDERARLLWISMGLCGTDVEDSEDANSSDGEQGIEYEYALGHSTTLRFFTADSRRFLN